MQKTSWLKFLTVAAAAGLLAGCASTKPVYTTTISHRPFGKTPDGTPVDLYTFRNANGVEVKICNYGGTVISFTAPDRNGNLADIVLGYDNLDDYIKNSPYFGCLVGRYGNRIAKGKFKLGDKEYTLAVNNEANHLHGGIKGFDKVVWNAKVVTSPEGPGLELTYTSKDGEEGYPGNLQVKALYRLTSENALALQYMAITDKDTVVNLTQHSYFNLAGKGDILGHVVMMPADRYTPVDSTLIPTGEMASVAGTPFDFRQPTAIGARINQDNEQLKFGKGYDHNWVFSKPNGQLTMLATVLEPNSGRVLEVFSTSPGLQFYSGNFLDGTIKGKGGQVYQFRNGFCMEPQHYPDSPNQPNFPSVVLKPGMLYKNTIVYRLSVQP
jgi:aldose 1-epimerase